MVVSRGWGEGAMGSCSVNIVSVWEDEKALDMDGGDGCTTKWIYLMPLNCILQNGWNSKFYIKYIKNFKKLRLKKEET